MELSNEERVEREQLLRQRWNWLGVILLGVVVIVAAAGGGSGGVAVLGAAVAVAGAVMRGRATKRLQLVEARRADRVS